MLDIIRKLCQQNGITVTQLENEIGISKNSIYRWQANKPSIDKVQKVAAYFGVTTSDLLGEDTKKDPAQSAESKLDIEFASLVEDLTEDELREVMEYMRFKKAQRGKL